MSSEQVNVANNEKEVDQVQVQVEPIVNAVIPQNDCEVSNTGVVLPICPGLAVEHIESFLISSLNKLRQENKNLDNEYRQLKNLGEIKQKDRMGYLNMMNMPSSVHENTLLKLIYVKQINVIDKLKKRIEDDKIINLAYDEHCETVIKHIQKHQQVVKEERRYDQITNMSNVELSDLHSVFRQNICLNITEETRLKSQLQFDKDQHKTELISIKKDISNLNEVLRDASQLVQDLQFKVAQMRRGGLGSLI